MTTTILFVSLVGLVLLAIVLWGLLLWVGLRWARVTRSVARSIRTLDS